MQIKQTCSYYVISALAVSAAGFFLQYVYSLFPGVFIGILTATNGSIFEQMKILLWPTVIFMAIHEGIFRNGDFEGQTRYLFSSLIIIPFVIGILKLIIPRYPLLLNTLSVNTGIAVFFSLCYISRKRVQPLSIFEKIAAPILMIAMITVFIAFSFNPPRSDFFADPTTGDYGMIKALRLYDRTPL